MINLDKEKVNKNINEAYEYQTDKVKELLDSAKSKIDEEDKKDKYTVIKNVANKVYSIRRIEDRKNKENNNIENNLNMKFDEMSNKLEVNSKNLDFIFNNVAKKEEESKQIISKISEETARNGKLVIEVKDILAEHIQNIKVIDEEKILDSQKQLKEIILSSKIEFENKLINFSSESENRIIKASEKVENKILEFNTDMKDEILNSTNSMEEKLEKVYKEAQGKILNMQTALENRVNQIQISNEQKLEDIRIEIVEMYKENNKSSLKAFLEEKNIYLNELDKKDIEIRELKYKIYKYEEMLEKAKERKTKFNILAPFYKEKAEEEEQVVYPCQILNYVY